MTRPTYTTSPGNQRIIAALASADEPLTPHEIAARCFVSWHTFQNYRQTLIDEGHMYLVDYVRNHHGPAVPRYAAGRRPEGTKPPVPPKARTSGDRKRDNGYYTRLKAERRLRRPPDPALRALIGISAQ